MSCPPDLLAQAQEFRSSLQPGFRSPRRRRHPRFVQEAPVEGALAYAPRPRKFMQRGTTGQIRHHRFGDGTGLWTMRQRKRQTVEGTPRFRKLRLPVSSTDRFARRHRAFDRPQQRVVKTMVPGGQLQIPEVHRELVDEPVRHRFRHIQDLQWCRRNGGLAGGAQFNWDDHRAPRNLNTKGLSAGDKCGCPGVDANAVPICADIGLPGAHPHQHRMVANPSGKGLSGHTDSSNAIHVPDLERHLFLRPPTTQLSPSSHHAAPLSSKWQLRIT